MICGDRLPLTQDCHQNTESSLLELIWMKLTSDSEMEMNEKKFEI
jgi:hypothetical protein